MFEFSVAGLASGFSCEKVLVLGWFWYFLYFNLLLHFSGRVFYSEKFLRTHALR